MLQGKRQQGQNPLYIVQKRRMHVFTRKLCTGLTCEYGMNHNGSSTLGWSGVFTIVFRAIYAGDTQDAVTVTIVFVHTKTKNGCWQTTF